MKPDVDRFLGVAAQHLLTRTVPNLTDKYEQSSAGSLAGLMIAIAQEFERGAARRLEENEAIVELFRAALPQVEDRSLVERLERVGASTDEDYSISALERRNAELRALLIELHEHVESLDSDGARQVDAAIWRELARSTERRKLAMGPF